MSAIGAGEEDDIDLALRLGYLVIAKVSGPPYAGWFAEHYPEARSRHGALCPPGAWGRPFHCILLIGRNAEGYDHHDPWYPEASQPFRMADDDFQRCFAGEISVAEP